MLVRDAACCLCVLVVATCSSLWRTTCCLLLTVRCTPSTATYSTQPRAHYTRCTHQLPLLLPPQAHKTTAAAG
uniref:Putative secreted protein n=1 Tax=Anopheles marajoara TaxID=58244 RepID=A0A2M4CDJ0_9DIPT